MIEYLDVATEQTQAETSAREMINSNKYVVVDNTSLKSLSNGPVTPRMENQVPHGLAMEKGSLVPDKSY